jgi:hypothetical protein
LDKSRILSKEKKSIDMTIFEFETQYATEYMDSDGNKICFMPTSKGMNTGAIFTTTKEGQKIGGEYSIREQQGQLFLGWFGKEFRFSPTHDGFELFSGNVVAYRYTRPV